MKSLFLSRAQAKNLADDLNEYSCMSDSSDRDVFSGFQITFDDLQGETVREKDMIKMIPLPNYTEITEA
jgi:hypothetical protein